MRLRNSHKPFIIDLYFTFFKFSFKSSSHIRTDRMTLFLSLTAHRLERALAKCTQKMRQMHFTASAAYFSPRNQLGNKKSLYPGSIFIYHMTIWGHFPCVHGTVWSYLHVRHQPASRCCIVIPCSSLRNRFTKIIPLIINHLPADCHITAIWI